MVIPPGTVYFVGIFIIYLRLMDIITGKIISNNTQHIPAYLRAFMKIPGANKTTNISHTNNNTNQ